jgi:glycolate dehydrogenase FAD-binding subunit
VTEPIRRALGRVVGADAVAEDRQGRVRVRPADTAGVSAVLAAATRQGWTAAIEGAGSWQSGAAPADLILSLTGLERIVDLHPADLVATVGAGVALDRFRRAALDQGTWCALDPPGRAGRTIGSVIATATTGPLLHGYGPVRQQVLGLVVVTGDGTVTRSNAAAVPNAGEFDLVRVQVGGFGGFGIVTECRLRLRGLPRADATWVANGERDRLAAVARRLGEWHSEAVAIELLSPELAGSGDWLLAIRLVGDPDAVTDEGSRLIRAGPVDWQQLPAERAATFWSDLAYRTLSAPITFRLGMLPDGVLATLDLVAGRVGRGLTSAGPTNGNVRWSGNAGAAAVRDLRRMLAPREVPLTVERAPWPVLAEVGHFGAYREGIGPPVSHLRRIFDPGARLVVPLEGTGAA